MEVWHYNGSAHILLQLPISIFVSIKKGPIFIKELVNSEATEILIPVPFDVRPQNQAFNNLI